MNIFHIKRLQLKQLGIISLIVLCITSCGDDSKRIVPSRYFTVEARDTPAFSDIVVSNGIELFLIQDGRPILDVYTHDNVQRHVITEVRGGVLNVYLRDDISFDFHPTVKVDLHCSEDEIRSILSTGGGHIETDRPFYGKNFICELSGGGSIYAEFLIRDRLDMILGGGSNADIVGEANFLKISSFGGSVQKFSRLIVNECDIQISGGGVAELNVRNFLWVEASGGSRVIFNGRWSPIIRREVLTGGSTLRPY